MDLFRAIFSSSDSSSSSESEAEPEGEGKDPAGAGTTTPAEGQKNLEGSDPAGGQVLEDSAISITAQMSIQTGAIVSDKSKAVVEGQGSRSSSSRWSQPMDESVKGVGAEQPMETLDSETPGNPDTFQTPGNPGTSQTPGNPGTSQTPGNPGTSDELEARLSPPAAPQEDEENSFGPALPPGHIGSSHSFSFYAIFFSVSQNWEGLLKNMRPLKNGLPSF